MNGVIRPKRLLLRKGGAMKITFHWLAIVIVLFSLESSSADSVKIGVQVALTGDAAFLGKDTMNALRFANEYFFDNKYEFVVEDDQCSAKGALAVARKLVELQRLPFVLGVSCNESLLAAAPVYRKNKTVVLTTFASSGDQREIGRGIFRYYPPDNLGAEVLFRLVKGKRKRFAIYTEQNEFPVLLERTMKRMAAENGGAPELIIESVLPETSDHRSAFLKFRSRHVDSIFLNATAEPGYINMFRQLRQVGWNVPVYAVALPGSGAVLRALGSEQDGVVFANVPRLPQDLTAEGKAIYEAFLKRFGEPNSVSLGIALAVDSLRMLDEALSKEDDIVSSLERMHFRGMLGDLSFNKYGELEGISFERGGEPKPLTVEGLADAALNARGS